MHIYFQIEYSRGGGGKEVKKKLTRFQGQLSRLLNLLGCAVKKRMLEYMRNYEIIGKLPLENSWYFFEIYYYL